MFSKPTTWQAYLLISAINGLEVSGNTSNESYQQREVSEKTPSFIPRRIRLEI